MSKGQLGVLHTNVADAMSQPSLPSRTQDMRTQTIAKQIADLKNKEDAFFSKFGYANMKAFLDGLRKILDGSESDMRVIRRFSSNNLQRRLSQFKQANSNMFVNQEIRLILKGNGERIDQFFKKINGSTNGVEWVVDAPEMIILPQWNTQTIKNITNKFASKHFKTVNKGSDSTERLIDFLRGDGSKFIEVQIGKQKQSIDEFVMNNMVSPFGWKPNEFKDLTQRNPSMAKEIRDRIENFLYNDLCAGASEELNNVIREVMKAKFPLEKPETLAFFMGGEGWSTHSLGSFGELQAAIFFQYIAHKTPNKYIATQITNIIGDELNQYKQQKHTDLELFEMFGIQVKNYGGTTDYRTGEEKTVDVNLHPTEIAPLQANGVVDYLVNSYFNTDIEKYSESDLNTFFESYASELLNLDLTPEIPDQVLFYLVGGHLIPGSALLTEAFTQKTITVSSTISGKDGKSSEDYLPTDQEKRKEWNQPFHEWWKSTTRPITSGAFEPTDRNELGAWDKYISIHTSFTYSIFFEGHKNSNLKERFADYRLFNRR